MEGKGAAYTSAMLFLSHPRERCITPSPPPPPPPSHSFPIYLPAPPLEVRLERVGGAVGRATLQWCYLLAALVDGSRRCFVLLLSLLRSGVGV